MKVVFPSNPQVNDIFETEFRSFLWDGVRWKRIPKYVRPATLEEALEGEADGVFMTPETTLEVLEDVVPELFAKGVVATDNETELKFSKPMTQAEYDALGTYNDNVIYIIEDE